MLYKYIHAYISCIYVINWLHGPLGDLLVGFCLCMYVFCCGNMVLNLQLILKMVSDPPLTTTIQNWLGT